MNKITLGKTNLVIEKNGFGCLPIQRIREQDAVDLLHKAYDGGINFFRHGARVFRQRAEGRRGVLVDARQDRAGDEDRRADGGGLPEGSGDQSPHAENRLHRHLSVPQSRLLPEAGWRRRPVRRGARGEKSRAKFATFRSRTTASPWRTRPSTPGLYETLQFPFSYLAGEQEMELVRKCRETNMGFIAMKGMAGGLIRDGFTAAAWMVQQDGVVPIWGVQRESELDQFLQCIREGVELTDERKATIERDRKELCGEFCRGCGYCMPCPAGIEINQCARMSLMLRRAPAAAWLTEEWQQKMHQIENCRHCGHCMSKCPYGLNTPELLQANYKDYWEVLAASKAEK